MARRCCGKARMLLLSALLCLCSNALSPVDFVDITSGSRSRIDYGTGSLLPFTQRPWAMNSWALQTNNFAGLAELQGPLTHWWYHPDDRQFLGFRCTHQASPWIYDYGEFLITPAVGELFSRWPDKGSAFNRSTVSMGPHETNLTLLSYCTGPESAGGCTSAALTATERAALLRVRFAPLDTTSDWDQTRHLRVLVGRSMASTTDHVEVDQGGRVLRGYTKANSGGVPSGLMAVQEDSSHRAFSLRGAVRNGSTMSASFAVQLRTDRVLKDVQIQAGEDSVMACSERCVASEACVAFAVESAGALCRLLPVAVISGSDDSEALNGLVAAGWFPGKLQQEVVRFRHYFHMEFDRPIKDFVINKNIVDAMYVNGLEGVVSFDRTVTVLNVRIGTSFISSEQAALNLEREIPTGTDYGAVLAQSRKAWDRLLMKTELVDAGNLTEQDGIKAHRVWYTNLYRASIYPRMFFEFNASGHMVHYAPNDPLGRVFPGPQSTDQGFWDSYRTVWPLNSLIRADQMGLQIAGYLTAYLESGHLPAWSSPGDRGAMTGNMQDAAIADAVVKSHEITGFDAELAYRAILEDAFNVSVPYDKSSGRRKGHEHYLKLGYIPVGLGVGDEVSATLNYALADMSMSYAALKMGDRGIAEELRNRSEFAWRSLFDASYRGGFFRPKYANGTFDAPFDEYGWGGRAVQGQGQYTEASAMQYRFYAPGSAAALADAYAAAPGNGTMCAYLEDTFSGAAVFHKGQWGLHHEQTEMLENCIGQYEHNNQPVWHIPYMFAPAGCAERGQFWIRYIMRTMYGEGDMW